MAISLNPKHNFTPKEERWNIITHAFGLFASVFGMLLLYFKASVNSFFALMFYGFTLILVYFSSTLVHSSKTASKRKFWNTLDHIAVDLLIGGSYTALISLKISGKIATVILIGAWCLCIISILFKIICKEKPQWFSEICYLFLSVLWLLAYQQIAQTFSAESIFLWLGGVACYLIGFVIYKLNHLPYNHPIFHAFVLLGSTLHFIQIYSYSL